MFGMLKRGFKPAAKSAAKPAAQSAPVKKVAPKGKTKRYRAFAEDSTDPKKVVGTEHYYVVDEENDVFHVAGDEKAPRYTRKQVDLTPKVERHKRTGLVTKTTTYSTPEQHLAAKFKREGMQLREETGDFEFGAPKRSTWAGKEYGKAVNWRSNEEVKNRSEYARELQAIRGSGEFRDYLMEGSLADRPRTWRNSEPKAATDSGKYHRVRKGYDGNWYNEGEEPLAPPPKSESVSSPRQKLRLPRSRVFSRNAHAANPFVGPPTSPPAAATAASTTTEASTGSSKTRRKRKVKPTPTAATSTTSTSGGRPQGHKRLVNPYSVNAAKKAGVGVEVDGVYYVPKDQATPFNSQGSKEEAEAKKAAAAAAAGTGAGTGTGSRKKNVGAKAAAKAAAKKP